MATPMMTQYNNIKEKYKDSILFFRLGDFYEMFDQDALEVSELLDLTLTRRHEIPMCGIPYHSALPYIRRLLDLGKKIAVCEQLSSPDESGKLVERAVREVYTPGMVLEEDLLEARSNNFLMVAHAHQAQVQIAYVDYSTGYLGTSFSPSTGSLEFLYTEILRLAPNEILIDEKLYDDIPLREWLASHVKRVASLPDWYFDPARARESILNHFKVSHLSSLGFIENQENYLPLGILLIYLSQNMGSLKHLKHLEIYTGEYNLLMDEATIRNLELVRNLREGDSQFSFIKVLDNTKTGMGARLLRKWILMPSRNLGEINKRQQALSLFSLDPIS